MAALCPGRTKSSAGDPTELFARPSLKALIRASWRTLRIQIPGLAIDRHVTPIRRGRRRLFLGGAIFIALVISLMGVAIVAVRLFGAILAAADGVTRHAADHAADHRADD